MPSDEASFHPLAIEEISDAIDYYEAQRPGLGDAIDRQLRETTSKIVQFPKAAPMWRGRADHRVPSLPRYPYRVPYQIKLDQLRILALAHIRRRPGYWMNRLDRGVR